MAPESCLQPLTSVGPGCGSVTNAQQQQHGTPFGSYLDNLRAVAAGLCIADGPWQCLETNCSDVVLASFDLLQKIWAVSSKERNALMHAMHGNGAGSRATARKRKQKQSNNQANGFNLQQAGEILKLLSQLFQLLGLGGGGGNLLQQLSAMMGHGGCAKPKKIKNKNKNKQGGDGGLGDYGQGGGSYPSSPPTQPPQNTSKPHPKQKADVQKQPHTEQQLHKTPKTFAEMVRANTAFKPVWSLRQSDWTGPILGFDDFCVALDKPGNISATVQVNSEEQLEELQVLLKGDSPDIKRELNITAVMLAPKEAKQTEEDRPLRMVPGKISGKVQPRQAFVIPLQGQGPSLKRAAVVSAAPAVQPETVVVRLSVDAKYLQNNEWQSIQAKPKANAQAWLHRHVPEHVADKVFDMWAFQQESMKGGGKPVITGLLRIERSAAKALLGCSGKSTWFVEPLQWNNSVIESCDVEWVKKSSELDGPSYLQKVQSMAGDLGIARGWNGLGVRKPRSAEPPPKARAWRVTGVPRDWAASTLTQELTRAGLTELKVLSRKTVGKQVEWWVQANAQKDMDFIEIQAGEKVIVAVEAPRQRRQRTHTMKLASNGRVSYNQSHAWQAIATPAPRKSFYMGTPVKKPVTIAGAEKVPAENLDEDKSDAKMDNAGEPAGAKRTVSTPEKSPPAKRVAGEPKPPHNMKVKSIPADGNCLFEALAQSLGGKTARNVRASVVTHLTKHQGRYKPWWDGKEPTEAENACESWESYLTMLSKIGAWGSALEVSAAAVHYDRPIIVFQPRGVPEIYNGRGKGGAPIALWFRSKHYERLEGAFPPEVLTQAANGPMQGNRGGGSECGATSVGATRLSALPSLVHSNNKRGRCASPAPASTLSEQRKNSSSPAAATSGRGPCTPRAASEGQDAASASSRRTKRTEWTCPLCDFSTGVCKGWVDKKRAHINAWHPDEKEQLKIGFKNTLPALSAVKKGGVYSWKCPVCKLGLSADHNLKPGQVYSVIRKHREDKHPQADAKLFHKDSSFRRENASKATRQVRAAAVARRLLGFKRGDAGAHDPTFVTIPATGNGKQKRVGMSYVICKTCGSMALTAKRLAKIACEQYASSKGPKRKQLVERLRACLKNADISDDLKKGARTVLEIIDSGAFRTTDTAADSTHQIEAIVWPANFTVRFACVHCKRCVNNIRRLTGSQCPRKMVWTKFRKGQRDILVPLAAQAPSARQRAASRALDILGLQQDGAVDQNP